MTNDPMVLVIWFAEVSLEKPPMMAITLYSIAMSPKPTTGWGKTPGKAANHSHFAFLNRDLAKIKTTRRRWEKFLTVAIFGDVEFYTQPAKPKSKGSPANCHDNGAGSAAPPGFSILRSLSPPPDATD